MVTIHTLETSSKEGEDMFAFHYEPTKPSVGIIGKVLDLLYCLFIFGMALIFFVIPLVFLVWLFW